MALNAFGMVINEVAAPAAKMTQKQVADSFKRQRQAQGKSQMANRSRQSSVDKARQAINNQAKREMSSSSSSKSRSSNRNSSTTPTGRPRRTRAEIKQEAARKKSVLQLKRDLRVEVRESKIRMKAEKVKLKVEARERALQLREKARADKQYTKDMNKVHRDAMKGVKGRPQEPMKIEIGEGSDKPYETIEVGKGFPEPEAFDMDQEEGVNKAEDVKWLDKYSGEEREAKEEEMMQSISAAGHYTFIGADGKNRWIEKVDEAEDWTPDLNKASRGSTNSKAAYDNLLMKKKHAGSVDDIDFDIFGG